MKKIGVILGVVVICLIVVDTVKAVDAADSKLVRATIINLGAAGTYEAAELLGEMLADPNYSDYRQEIINALGTIAKEGKTSEAKVKAVDGLGQVFQAEDMEEYQGNVMTLLSEIIDHETENKTISPDNDLLSAVGDIGFAFAGPPLASSTAEAVIKLMGKVLKTAESDLASKLVDMLGQIANMKASTKWYTGEILLSGPGDAKYYEVTGYPYLELVLDVLKQAKETITDPKVITLIDSLIKELEPKEGIRYEKIGYEPQGQWLIPPKLEDFFMDHPEYELLPDKNQKLGDLKDHLSETSESHFLQFRSNLGNNNLETYDFNEGNFDGFLGGFGR